eukprot:2785665-Rhodomonas_salina.5
MITSRHSWSRHSSVGHVTAQTVTSQLRRSRHSPGTDVARDVTALLGALKATAEHRVPAPKLLRASYAVSSTDIRLSLYPPTRSLCHPRACDSQGNVPTGPVSYLSAYARYVQCLVLVRRVGAEAIGLLMRLVPDKTLEQVLPALLWSTHTALCRYAHARAVPCAPVTSSLLAPFVPSKVSPRLWCYGPATKCPVLRSSMPPQTCYGIFGTEVGYAGTRARSTHVRPSRSLSAVPTATLHHNPLVPKWHYGATTPVLKGGSGGPCYDMSSTDLA